MSARYLVLTRACIFCVILIVPACSWFSSESALQPGTSVESRPEQSLLGAQAEEGRANPFSFEIEEEINDGEEVHVRAHLESLAPVRIAETVVRLTGWKEGEAIFTKDYPMAELLGASTDGAAVFEERRRYVFGLSFPVRPEKPAVAGEAGSITDYQLELLWGVGRESPTSMQPSLGNIEPGASTTPLQAELGSASASTPSNTSAANVQFRIARVEQSSASCNNPPCGLLLRVTGELSNSGPHPVQKVILAVGFSGRPGAVSSSGEMPQGAARGEEEFVTMGNLGLVAGGSKTVRLVFERPIPHALANILMPSVRVTHVE